MRWLGPALLAVLGARLAAAAAAPPPRPPAPDGAGEAPVVDVADLPPLPIGSDQAASAATVRAAEEVSEEVVRGAAKRDQTLGNVASAVTVISGDRLRRFGYRTMAEALRAVAGVYVSDDRLGERVGIRGFQSLGDFNTRVLILIDGVTINEAWAAFAGVGADVAIGVDEIERIEVIRGPVSSVYGTNAFFGIVNVVTRSADGAPRAWARLGAGSLPRESVAAGLALGGGDRQLRAAVTGLVRQGEELTLPALSDQPLRGDDGATVAASVVGSYDGAFGQARIVRRQRAVPFAPYGAEPGPRNYVVDENQVVAEAGYTRALGARVSATGRLYVNAYRFADDYLAAGGAERIQTNGDGTALGAELRGRFVLLDRDRLGLTAGTELSTVDTESRATGTAAIGKTYGLQALYAEVDGAPTRWLSMTAGVRADRNSVLTNRVSPRAALLLSRRDRAGLKLLYAEGFRNASAYESFFEDGVDFVANPDIGPEVIRSVEAVAWARPRAGVSTRLSLFQWRATDLIKQRIDPASGLLQFGNSGAQRSRGVEVEASYRDARGWYGFAGAALAEVTGVDDAGVAVDVANAPTLTASGGASTPRLGGWGHLSAEVVVVGPRAARTRTSATFVGVDAALYVPNLLLAARGVDLTLGVRNLVGRREDVPAPEDFDRPDLTTPEPDDVAVIATVPGEGRELFVRVGYAY